MGGGEYENILHTPHGEYKNILHPPYGEYENILHPCILPGCSIEKDKEL